LDAKELTKIILNISSDCLIIPAHIYTPWFSLFGSRSGFDSLEECFEDYSKYIYAGETGLSCYDEKTEVLTNNGWKKFSGIQNSDEICTLNLNNNQIEFQKPLKKFIYHYKGKMYRLKTKRVDLLVTPNHKLLVSGCDFRRPPRFFLKEAKYLFKKSKRFKKDGIWIGENRQYFTLPAVKVKWGCRWYSGGSRIEPEKKFPMVPWLKFFGFWLAEGWTSKNEKYHEYNVYLSNKNNSLLLEMKKILESFGYNVYWDKKKNNTLRVRDYQLFHYLKQFGKCHEKFIPPEVKSLSKELLEIFFGYYIKGDGHIYGRSGKGISATTSSVKLRDDLQEIALKIGMSAYYKLHRKKGTPFFSPSRNYKKMYKQKEDSWVVYFIRHNLHAVLPSVIKKFNYTESWVDFNGKVYSLAVPNHVIYVRRNGIPVWCGNSDPPMSWRNSKLDRITLISCSDAHSPEHIGREACVFEGEELSYKAIVEAIKTKNLKPKSCKLIYTIEFFPEEGKYHYDGHRNCGIRLSPKETKKYNGICPVCSKPLTIGVLNRVEQLADRPEGFIPKNAIPFKSLIPLKEIIADALGQGVETAEVEKEYQNLIAKFENEFNVLLNVQRSDLEKATLPEIAEGIIRVREGKVIIEPGYDGVYGKIRIFQKGEQKSVLKQGTLF
jgi:PHP family Zn ribbon phosphoesterase